jgi:hypothetical protein
MTTSNNKLKIGCFYPVKGEVMKFVGFRANGYKETTEFSFHSWRGTTHTLERYDSLEAEDKAFGKMAGWLQERCIKNGTRLCEGEQIDAIARCKVTDIAVINDYNENQSATSESMYNARSRFD